MHTGIDDIDRSLEQLLINVPGNSLRNKREEFENINNGLHNFYNLLDPVLDKITQHKRKMFGLAYDKERRQKDWGNPKKAHITLLMLGGGCKTNVIKNLDSQVLC